MEDAAPDARGCEIYWAPTTLLSAAHDRFLNPIERKRSWGFRRPSDRTRFALATALLRLATGDWLQQSPEQIVIDRFCDRCQEPHGPPRLPGTGLHASISHSHQYVAVALSDVAPIGVDIQRVRQASYAALLNVVCTAEEQYFITDEADFYAYWTRKESVLKATGVGLSLPMTDIVVTPPTNAPRVVSYSGGGEFVGQMHEFSFHPNYACAATVLTDAPTLFRVLNAERLLGAS